MGCIKLDILEQDYKPLKAIKGTLKKTEKVAQRFLSVDPLAAKYPHNSPYAFSENRVIDAVELEGLESARLNLPPDLSQNQINDVYNGISKTSKTTLKVTGSVVAVVGATMTMGAVMGGVLYGTMSTGTATLGFSASATTYIKTIATLFGVDDKDIPDAIVPGGIRDLGYEKTADVVNIAWDVFNTDLNGVDLLNTTLSTTENATNFVNNTNVNKNPPSNTSSGTNSSTNTSSGTNSSASTSSSTKNSSSSSSGTEKKPKTL